MGTTPEVAILSACRTPVGRFLGALAGKSAVELGSVAAREAIRRSGADPAQIGEAIVGCVLPAGQGQAPARQVALKAGMPPSSSALTVNMVCGSGLRAAMLAAGAIRSGEADLLLAGGIESMSNAPHLLSGGRLGWKFGERALVDHMQHDGLTCAIAEWPMGMAAERTAEQCGLDREGLDRFALESHRRAVAAQAEGAFRDEIVPVPVWARKGESLVEADETPRADSSLESLGKLLPAFKPDGIVTAGNASGISDGAAMLVLASQEAAREAGAEPLAIVRGWGVAGLDPRDLFLAPVQAVPHALAHAGVDAKDVDLYEINEAFASQMLGCIGRLELDPAKVNVYGGAIALGHPIGASGARILVTLVHVLRRRGGRIGVASLCLGGGNAVAMVIERC